MVTSFSGVSYNKPTYSVQNKQKPPQPTIEELQKMSLAGGGMSFERFREILESDAPIEEKLAEMTEAFGSIMDKDSLASGINAAKSGKMSAEELYRRSYARSWGRALTMEEARDMMEESQRVRRPQCFTGRNAPENLQKAAPIIAKVNAGRKLTPEEKSFLREYYPEAYEHAMKTEQEAERVKKAMENAKSPEEAQRILMEAKMAALAGDVNGSNTNLIQMLSSINTNNPGVSMFDIEA